HTVNTLPPATLDSFLDHGVVANTIKSDMQTALDQLVQLEALGIDLAAVTAQLQEEGVAAFAKSFHDMMKSIAGKRHHLLAARQQYHLRLGSYEPA
ncbi:MAG: transaldolase, partial [Calditrichaeota bacterium]|nr:transaldolase [Calditrichota bacterium]